VCACSEPVRRAIVAREQFSPSIAALFSAPNLPRRVHGLALIGWLYAAIALPSSFAVLNDPVPNGFDVAAALSWGSTWALNKLYSFGGHPVREE
jgi:hypothetical protein